MIVEFTGPSGCGKSTLIASIAGLLKEGDIPIQVIGEGSHHPHIKFHPKVQDVNQHSIFTDIRLAPFASLFIVCNCRLFLLLLMELFSIEESIQNKLSIVRSIWRKMGINQMVIRDQKICPEIVWLIDEGIIHSSHNIFVTSTGYSSEKVIKNFARMVPCPTVVVFVTASAEAIEQRLLIRKDISPRLSNTNQIRTFTLNAKIVFKILRENLKGKYVSFVDTSSEIKSVTAEKILNVIISGKVVNDNG